MKTTALLMLCATLLALPVLAQTTADPSPPALNLADSPLVAATPAPPQIVVLPAPIIPAPSPTLASNLSAWAMVGTLVISMLFALVGYALKKAIELKPAIEELRGRQDRQAAKTGSLQEQVTANARAITPAEATPATPPKPGAGSVIGVPLVALLALFATSCSTTTANPARNARNAGMNAAGRQVLDDAVPVLTNAVVSSLVSVVKQEATTGRLDYVQAATAGLYVNVDGAKTVAEVKRIATSYSAGKAALTATAAANAFAVARSNGVPAPVAIDTIAGVLATAAGAPPAP